MIQANEMTSGDESILSYKFKVVYLYTVAEQLRHVRDSKSSKNYCHTFGS